MIKSILLVLTAANSARAVDYSSVLGGLYTQSDANKDGELDLKELKVALKKLGIEEKIWTKHGGKTDNLFTSADKDSSKGIKQKELADLMTDYPSYKEPLKAAFTNGAGAVPTDIPTVSDKLKKAKAKVKMALELAGSIGDIYPGQRKEIKEWFATKCGVTAAEVFMTFSNKPAAAARRLAAAGGVNVEGTAFVADDAAAAAAAKALPKDAAAFNSEAAFSGLSVTSAKTEAAAPPKISFTGAIAAGIVLIGGGLVMCFLATGVSKSNAKAAGVQGGCCKAGCCSFFAVRSWAFGEFVAVVAIFGSVVFLFTRMSGLTNVIIGLLDTMVALTKSNVSAIKSMTASIPTGIIDIIAQQKSIISLLPFAVMGPGLVACVGLLGGAVCPLFKDKHKGSYCVTKCFNFIANIFLALSFIFYAIFAGVALVLENAPPVIADQIKMITGMCDTIPPWIKQLLADNTAAVEQLKAAKQDVTELQKMLDDVADLTTIIGDGCKYLNGFFEEFVHLFLPGTICLVAIMFAFFVNNTLCCSAGCCKGPPLAASSSGKADGKGTEMTTPSQQV